MRDIKFRAWDKEKQRMLPITLIDYNEWWVSCKPVLEQKVSPLEYGERNSFKNEDTDRHILMQYIGVKDIDGVEIYEGDVIRENEYFHCLYKVIYDDIGCKFIGVKIGDRDCNTLDFPQLSDDGEVVGNIYENSTVISHM